MPRTSAVATVARALPRRRAARASRDRSPLLPRLSRRAAPSLAISCCSFVCRYFNGHPACCCAGDVCGLRGSNYYDANYDEGGHGCARPPARPRDCLSPETLPDLVCVLLLRWLTEADEQNIEGYFRWLTEAEEQNIEEYYSHEPDPTDDGGPTDVLMELYEVMELYEADRPAREEA